MSSRGGGARQGGAATIADVRHVDRERPADWYYNPGDTGAGFLGNAGTPEPAVNLGPNPGVARALAANGRAIKDLPTEHARLFDAQGNALVSKDGGQQDRVAYSPTEVRMMPGAYSLHNHPRGSSFSLVDITHFFANNLAGVDVAGAQYHYSLRPPRGGWSRDLRVSDIERIFTEARRNAYSVEIHRAIMSGQMSAEQASQEQQHATVAAVAQHLGMTYTREPWK